MEVLSTQNKPWRRIARSSLLAATVLLCITSNATWAKCYLPQGMCSSAAAAAAAPPTPLPKNTSIKKDALSHYRQSQHP